jgi:hypothetical protein
MLIEKGPDGRLKRIEYRGKYLRASRTGGVALRAQAKAAGINFTANTNRGSRVSNRIAKGTQAAFQNGRFVLRGRYGDGPNKVNLSKSGVSVSTKTDIGTINWFKPRYSSVKIGGVQVRGKNAVYLHLIVGLFQLAAYLLLFLAQLAILLVQLLYWLGVQLVRGTRAAVILYEDRKFRPYEDKWMAALESFSTEDLKQGLDFVVFELGSGRAIEADQIEKRPSKEQVAELLEACPLKPHRELELMTACLASRYQQATDDEIALEKFFLIDEQLSESTKRNELQDRLLAAYAEACGIEAGADSPTPASPHAEHSSALERPTGLLPLPHSPANRINPTGHP